jgi:hypothetical protein
MACELTHFFRRWLAFVLASGALRRVPQRRAHLIALHRADGNLSRQEGGRVRLQHAHLEDLPQNQKKES